MDGTNRSAPALDVGPLFPLSPGPRCTQNQPLLIDCNWLARNWVCFVFFSLCPKVMRSSRSPSQWWAGQVPSSDGERMASGRAGIMPIRRARALTGSSRCSTPASLRGSYPVQAAENSRTRGPSDSPHCGAHLAKNHNASETNLTPDSVRKSGYAGSKDGLAVG